jgi:hypothetical protein
MRTIVIATFLADILPALLSLAILPDRVAIHFGLSGAADSWTSSLNDTLLQKIADARIRTEPEHIPARQCFRSTRARRRVA